MNICYYTIVKEGGPIMSYENLVKELQSVRTLPAEYINERGNNVTDECCRYLLPLIRGEAYPHLSRQAGGV